MVGINPNIKYAACPICKNLPENLRNGINQYYGKVPIERWEELIKIRNKALCTYTLEKRIEIYENVNGSITIDFHARCLNCGARWDFKQTISEGSDL